MDETAKARDPAEQAAITRQLSGFSSGNSREDWPDPLGEPCELAHDELDLLPSKVTGHRWNGWHCLTGDEGYFAVCSCGWRSSGTGSVSPMLGQVKEHFDAIRVVRGSRPATRAAPAPRRDERERDVGRREMRQERTRELYASVESQQRRLSQTLEHSADLLASCGDQADRFVAVLDHAAAKVAPEWAKTGDSVRCAEVLQRQGECAKELRTRIVAAAGAVAAIAGEVALLGQNLETRRLSGSAEYERLADEPANRNGGREVVADDLHPACGLG